MNLYIYVYTYTQKYINRGSLFIVFCCFFLIFSFFALHRRGKKSCAVKTNALDFFLFVACVQNFFSFFFFLKQFTYLCYFFKWWQVGHEEVERASCSGAHTKRMMRRRGRGGVQCVCEERTPCCRADVWTNCLDAWSEVASGGKLVCAVTLEKKKKGITGEERWLEPKHKELERRFSDAVVIVCECECASVTTTSAFQEREREREKKKK